MIDSNGLVIFDRIRELKNEGLALPEIQARFESGMQAETQGEQQPIETTAIQETQVLTKLLDTQARLNDEMTARLEDTRENEERLRTEQARHFRELQERESTIADLQRKVDSLDTALKMLPDGKPPEQIRSEYEEQRRTLAENERRAHEREQADTHKQQELKRIATELKACKWYEGKKRRGLLAELEALEEQA